MESKFKYLYLIVSWLGYKGMNKKLKNFEDVWNNT